MKVKQLLGRCYYLLNRRAIRVLLGVFLLCILYREINSRGVFSDIGIGLYEKFSEIQYLDIIIILFLVFSNWFLETIKWNMSINKISSISLFDAFRAVLTGLSWGIFTPHRIGDYGGRIMYLSADKRMNAARLNFVNGLSQNLNHFIFGSIGCFYIAEELLDKYSVGYLVTLISCCFVFLWIYFDLDRFIGILLRVLPHSVLRHKLFSTNKLNLEPLFLSKLILLSLFRYFCYIFLYVYLLRFFGADVSFYNLMFYVSVIFLIQSGIPLPASLAMLARIEIAILILSLIGLNVDVIVLSSLGLWILNIAIPAFIGILVMSFCGGTNPIIESFKEEKT